jgi:hypothetical protein
MARLTDFHRQQGRSFNTSEQHGSFDSRTTPCSNEGCGKEGTASVGGGAHGMARMMRLSHL